MPRFQLRCGRCPLHASETAVCFSPAHPKFQKSIFCRIDLQDSSMICSYFFNDIFVPFRPPGGLARSATRRQNVGFHLQHLIWHFLQPFKMLWIVTIVASKGSNNLSQRTKRTSLMQKLCRNYSASRCVPKKYQSNNQNHVYIYI